MESLRYTENWRWKCSIQSLPVAVGAESGTCTLYATNSPTGSSVLRPRSSIWTNYRYSAQDRAYFFPVTEIEIKVLGISELLSQFSPNSGFILKLDTQGSEFSILSGLSDYFKSNRVLAVESEVSLLNQPPYEDAPRLWDVVGAMEDRGFETLQIDVIERATGNVRSGARGAVAEADVLFVLRRELVMNRDLNSRLQLLCIYVTYGLFCEAELLLNDDSELSDFLEAHSQLGKLKL